MARRPAGYGPTKCLHDTQRTLNLARAQSGAPTIFKKLLTQLFVLLLLTALAVVGWAAYWLQTPLPWTGPSQEFALRSGSGLRSVAQQLQSAGLLDDTWRFVILARAMRKDSSIKAGYYELRRAPTPLELLEKITEGDVSQTSITLVEGWNFRQIRQALDQNPGLKHETTGKTDQEILQLLGAAESHPEGLFFPETYFVAAGGSDLAVLQRSYRLMQKNLADAWAGRSQEVNFESPYQALILASIVEKETGKAVERPQIAAVFLNRLRLGMRLQTDPTVIYGLGAGFDGNLRKRDLQTDTPYNTYTRNGLPPTPIASPGLGALLATLHPASSTALYFVAKGDGSHQFSTNLADHNRAVNRFQRGGR